MAKDTETDGTLPYFVRDRIERLLFNLGVGGRPMTHDDLADRITPPMDKGQLSRLLSGKQMVRLDSLQRIAKALGAPLATLFEGERTPVSNMVEMASLLTAQHQEAIRALGELARAEGAAARSHRLGAADRRAQDNAEHERRSR